MEPIKPHELRLGNYVNLILGDEDNPRQNNTTLVVVTIGKEISAQTLKGRNFTGLYNDFAGIPLTEEWLERCGFKREGRDFVNDSITNSIRIADSHTPDFKYITIRYDAMGSIYYVHQLQNWIYILTNKELTIKELV